MLMLSGAGEAAYQLATTKIPDLFHTQEALPLFSMTPCNGWPKTLEHHCTVAWKFLNSLISTWDWLKTAFGNERESRVGIVAYYQMLSFLNFLKLAKDGELEPAQDLKAGRFPVSAPLSFCVWPADIVNAGYRSFLKQAPILRRLLEANHLNQVDFEVAWNKWMAVAGNWLGHVYVGMWPEMHVPQRNLPSDLNTNPYALD
jgi:hypothetical protein